MTINVAGALAGLTLAALVLFPGPGVAADAKSAAAPEAASGAKAAATKPAATSGPKKKKKDKPAPAGAATAKAGGAKAGGAKAVVRTPAEQAALSSGVLSEADVGLNCKKMAGRMKIRLLELRGGGPSRKSSDLAQGMHSAVVPLFGGTQRGADASSDVSRDIAKLKAMNEIMTSRKCPHYDIDAELAQPSTARSPQLIRGSGDGGKPAKAKGLGGFLSGGKR